MRLVPTLVAAGLLVACASTGNVAKIDEANAIPATKEALAELAGQTFKGSSSTSSGSAPVEFKVAGDPKTGEFTYHPAGGAPITWETPIVMTDSGKLQMGYGYGQRQFTLSRKNDKYRMQTTYEAPARSGLGTVYVDLLQQ